MSEDTNIQIKSTVLEGLGSRKAMFMPMVCVSSFMLVGYAALDTEAPEIITDTLELEINQGIDPSMIKVVDNLDDRSAITVVVDQTNYNPSQEGSYVVSVTAYDSFNNETTKDIPVIIKDKKAPVIKLNEGGEGYSSESNVLKVRYNSDGDIRKYVTAIDDNKNSGDNGDLTAFINQGTVLDTSKLGAQFIDLSVTDDAGNETSQSIPVYVIDDVAPDLQLKDGGDAKINYGSSFNLSEFAKAIDEYYGNLTDKIQVEGTAPNTKVMGATSTIKLTVEDESGNKVEKELKLTVADTEAPTISFAKNNLVVPMGSASINVADYVSASDNYDNDINSRVTYSSSVIDTSTEGDKSVTVTAVDNAGNVTTKSFNVKVYDPATYGPTQIVSFARSKLGLPYILGGNGNPGYDCSGLVHAALRSAGISAPRTVSSLYYADNQTHIWSYSQLQPGDILYYNTEGWLAHCGIYIGNGQMIHAPQEGDVVKISNIYSSYWTNCFQGAGRFY